MRRLLVAVFGALALVACSSDDDAEEPTSTTVPGPASSPASTASPPTSTLPPGGPVDPNELSTRRLDQIEAELAQAEAALDRLERR